MIQLTFITWILLLFGLITNLPLLYVQFRVIMGPDRRDVKDLVIRKGMDWRDETHFRSAIGSSRADWLIFGPLFILGTCGVWRGSVWGYLLYAAAGAIMLYISITLWFQEKKYVYPSVGSVAYFTYYWGNFVYWGGLSFVYATLRLEGISL